MGIKNTTWKHIRRSPYQSIAAVITIFLTFLLGGFFFLATITSALVLRYFESKPQMTVFFNDQAAKSDTDQLSKDLENTGKVASVKFVSKDDALAIYKEQNKNDPLLLEMVTADILPASLEISALDPKYLSDLEPLVKKSTAVEEVVYQKDVVNSLLTWTNAIRVIGGTLAGLLAFDSILIVMTVIGMKIAVRRDEIEILKLVGASPWYIRMPFVFEGGFYGMSGALFAWVIITGLIIWFRPYIYSFLNIIPIIKIILHSLTDPAFILSSVSYLLMLLVSGIILGCIGSLVAVGRYLKV
jgi:cell division transport system permease protein